jgi:hypothetical protein
MEIQSEIANRCANPEWSIVPSRLPAGVRQCGPLDPSQNGNYRFGHFQWSLHVPRLLNSPPKYRLHKPLSRAVVTLNGLDHYLAPWNSKASKAAYDRSIGEWLANGRPRTNFGWVKHSLKRQRRVAAAGKPRRQRAGLGHGGGEGCPAIATAALVHFCLTLFNANEFVHLD